MYYYLKTHFQEMLTKKNSCRKMNYNPKLNIPNKLRPVVIAGPSGVGKSTLIKKLIQNYPNEFGFSVSHTTRNIRKGEVDEKNYYFIDTQQFLEKVKEKCFIEYAKYANNFYGTSYEAVENLIKLKKICILDIDTQGFKRVKNIIKSKINVIYIFIKPKSLDQLKTRLEKRGTETKNSIEMRLKIAEKEINFAQNSSVYNKIIVNDDVNIAYSQLTEYLKNQYDQLA
ncbi:hypothetical protein A3Q56_05738 [Intoshia linei]|uniref:guanylate kinase n=1 Tax=Intoshia linei TaxID=1819745 RepID=A0A177AYP7_9BILA|nr:hypothetical protein A3Q56_05738 [Intoshia linei]